MSRLLAITLAVTAVSVSPAAEPTSRPNVLLIVADDLGYSDIGCYGSEIATPNLDGLAKSGLRYTQFYNTARCWPTRSAILTGYYAQQIRRDLVPGVVSGARGTRPDWAVLLPEMLKPLGYRSYHSGKWHVDGKPLRGGFDRSYSLEDHDRHFGPKNHTKDDKPLPAANGKEGYYSSTAIADFAVEQLKEHAEKYEGKPFFSYVAFTAPHFPLQAPASDVAKYEKAYLEGWEKARAARWDRLKAFAIPGMTLSPVERDVGPPYKFPEALKKLGPNEVDRPRVWDDLTADQRKFQAAKMAIHAAMIDRMDREIGRILEQVKAMKATEDTLVMFLSDNGASAEMMVRGDGHDPEAACGSGATFLCLGPGWSTTANTPFRRHKTWVHEGGISTPFVVSWPKGIAARGEFRHTPGHVVDLVPTVLEAAGGKPPVVPNGVKPPPPPGVSLVPTFAEGGSIKRNSIWWQHEGNRAYRVNNWKIVAAGKDAEWELYDLAKDRAEANNLAATQPERVRTMAAAWQKEYDAIVELARK